MTTETEQANASVLFEQAERHQEERRGWHVEALERNEKANKAHDTNLTRLVVVALIRPIVELAILITLWIKL